LHEHHVQHGRVAERSAHVHGVHKVATARTFAGGKLSAQLLDEASGAGQIHRAKVIQEWMVLDGIVD
jgi:hypothetical protein